MLKTGLIYFFLMDRIQLNRSSRLFLHGETVIELAHCKHSMPNKWVRPGIGACVINREVPGRAGLYTVELLSFIITYEITCTSIIKISLLFTKT